MSVNKVVYNGNTLIDLTDDTLVNSNQLASGVVAHTKDGRIITGTLDADISGGDYNISYTDNGDGTQDILIEDAEGASGGNSNIDESITTFDTENSTLQLYKQSARNQYINNDITTIIANYVDVNANNDKPNGYTINGLNNGKIYILDEVNGKSYIDDCTNSYTIYNLIPKHTYRFINMDNLGIKNIGRIKDLAEIRMIKVNEVKNIRDIGGRNCDGGTVKYGLIFRGGKIRSSNNNRSYLTDKEKDLFRNILNITYEIDMQKDDEVYNPNEQTSVISADTTYKKLSMTQGYKGGFSTTSSQKATVKEIIETIMNNTINEVITYFHCSAGADRTGTVASILNGVLGVSQLELDIDYEITSLVPDEGYLRPRYALESSGKYWKEWKDYIHTFEGNNPYVTYCQQLGISNDLLNSFRRKMIDGIPSEITGGGSTEEPDVPTGVNVLSLAIDTDKTPYNNGLGYKNGYRLNSSGGETSISNTSLITTGYIPFEAGKTITVENLLLFSTFGVTGESNYRITYYDSTFTYKATKMISELVSYPQNVSVVEGDYCKSLTINTMSSSGSSPSGMVYIRISGELTGIPAIYIS